MWPYQHLQENVVSPSLTEAEEVESLSSYASSPPMSPRGAFGRAEPDTDSESDDDNELLQPDQRETECTSVDLLLLKSLESYVLSVRTAEDLRSSRVLRPPRSQVLRPNRYSNRSIRQFAMHPSSAHPSENDARTHSEDESSLEERESHSTSTPKSPNNRSTGTFKANTSPSEGSPPPNMSQPRRRLRSVQNMPQPSLLAKQVANRVIKYARCARNIHEEDMCCLNCGLFPICPVTGKCGHTRCSKCIEVMTRCPCGHESPKPLFVNILIRDLVGKTTSKCPTPRSEEAVPAVPAVPAKTAIPVNKLLNGARGSCSGPIRSKRRTRPYIIAPFSGPYQQHVPMSARARFTYALELLQSGRHKDAAPQLALAAASCHSDLRVARPLLAQVIMVLSKNRDPRGLTRELNHVVRHLSSMPWIKTGDMECILCCDIFTKPVTTPCGHMFCRTCLEKTLDYRKRCPLCLRGLGDFKLTETSDTVFVKGALASINALNIPKPMEEDDLVPIFVCTVAYPSVPCPLFIFDPRYWLMIRRVLESGSRRFGMVAMDRDKKYADYGTILEVRDCVHLEDGRSILSTIGLSRFKVIERSVRDGCEVARIQPIHDIPPDEGMATDDLKMYASQIMLKAILWLSQLSSKVLSDIESAFGALPTTCEEDENEEWWESSDGPAWLWWLVAVLPLRTEIKVLILSTDCLIKRMMAVARTLEAVEHVALTTMAPGQYQVRVTMPNNNALLN